MKYIPAMPTWLSSKSRMAWLVSATVAMTAICGAGHAEERSATLGSVGQPKFSHQTVVDLAKRLSQTPYKPVAKTPASAKLPGNYDDYRKLRFRPERALWRSVPREFELHALAAGWLFKQPISLSIVTTKGARAVAFSLADFEDQRVDGISSAQGLPMPLSGFRINGALNATNRSDEIIVFQGASYFRALGKDHRYGLSARGLALGTASRKGEEFPSFREFWVEKPATGSTAITIHALLDSASATGAYLFVVKPGAETIVDVKSTLYPRREITEIGIAPLTSMHLLAPNSPTRVSDFRPRVHDSDGLAIDNGRGERIWRPLHNPYVLQTSYFVDVKLKGFGLMQRPRQFAEYQDLEARYDLRPSAWIEPGENFDKGSVILVEIPTEQEIHDNIVAFWRPAEKLVAGHQYTFAYRIRWRDASPSRAAGPWVSQTRSGMAHAKPDAVRFVVDYIDGKPFIGAEPPVATVSATSGSASSPTTQLNSETGGIRASFLFTPGGSAASDIRLTLSGWDGRTPETWIYRWSGKKR